MPELPEVEVMRRDLDKEVLGRKIKSVEVTGARSIRRHRNRKEFIDALTGHKFTGVQRRGKYLVLRLDGGDALVVHLGMSGQLLRVKTAREKAPKHTHVVITFQQGGLLRFVDPRTFGEMFVTAYDGIEQQVDELAHIGVDPLEQPISWTDFGRMLAARSTRLKALLMDQTFIAGIGNIYADEALFSAGIHPGLLARRLTTDLAMRLAQEIRRTLHEAIDAGGSTLRDYVDATGRTGSFQESHRVYGRGRQPCLRCRSTLRSAPLSGRTTTWCPTCQSRSARRA